jgi:hypothetical protein
MAAEARGDFAHAVKEYAKVTAMQQYHPYKDRAARRISDIYYTGEGNVARNERESQRWYLRYLQLMPVKR